MLEFKCTYNQPKQTILDNVSASIHERGGHFSGDTKKGTFDIGERLGRFSGHYQMGANEITISITRKPIYISNQNLESQVRAYFNRQLIGPVSGPAVEKETMVEDDELALVNS